jgi:hypothetical protein
MKTLIVGFGQIGKALFKVLNDVYQVDVDDITCTVHPENKNFDILHICFPCKDDFENEVAYYKRLYKPKWIVIHSTVAVGVSRQCNAIHSPVIGLHPNLAESLLTFTKFLGGEDACYVADYFRKAGMKVYLFDKQETTEALKIMSTTFYAVLIEYTKQVKQHCNEIGIPFEAWTIWTDEYNAGYNELGRYEYTRPNLVPIMKRLGGHCILPNCELLEDDFTRLIQERNKE